MNENVERLVKYYKTYGVNNSISQVAEQMLSNGDIKIIIQAREIYTNEIKK